MWRAAKGRDNADDLGVARYGLWIHQAAGAFAKCYSDSRTHLCFHCAFSFFAKAFIPIF